MRGHAMIEWEYRKIDLNQVGPRRDELDLLNAAGREGWELVGISVTNVAYLKRRTGDAVSEDMPGDRRMDQPPKQANGGRASPGHEALIRYRDPTTNQTWTGRGRMATWLKTKRDAGEDV